jgi:hypothetical protein
MAHKVKVGYKKNKYGKPNTNSTIYFCSGQFYGAPVSFSEHPPYQKPYPKNQEDNFRQKSKKG